MRWITHIAIASLFIKLLEIALLIDLTSYEGWIVLSLYAVMADFDSLLGIEHRTYTHTLYAALLTSLPLIFDLRLFITALSAYLSHLFADMLTLSGVMLLYPFRETTYHFLPAAWRIKTGSNAELMLLTAVVILIASFSMAASTTELDKIFYYRSSNDIYADISFYENGVLKSFNRKKIVWDDGNGKIGIVVDGRLKIIDKEQIKSIKITEMHEVARKEKEKRVVLKRLKIMDEIVTAYNNGYGWIDFLGTGKDLFYELYDGSNGKEKVKIKVIECWIKR